jgi:hypothetical protein
VKNYSGKPVAAISAAKFLEYFQKNTLLGHILMCRRGFGDDELLKANMQHYVSSLTKFIKNLSLDENKTFICISNYFKGADF